MYTVGRVIETSAKKKEEGKPPPVSLQMHPVTPQTQCMDFCRHSTVSHPGPGAENGPCAAGFIKLAHCVLP